MTTVREKRGTASQGETPHMTRYPSSKRAWTMVALLSAAYVLSYVDRSILDAGPFLRTNVVGTETMLRAVKPGSRMRLPNCRATGLSMLRRTARCACEMAGCHCSSTWQIP